MWEKFKKYIIMFWLVLTGILIFIIGFFIKWIKKPMNPIDEVNKNVKKNNDRIIRDYADYSRKRMRDVGDKK